MRRDDDLVRAERSQRVLDRLKRLLVADLAADDEPGLGESGDRRADALLRGRAGAVDVRDPVLDG